MGEPAVGRVVTQTAIIYVDDRFVMHFGIANLAKFFAKIVTTIVERYSPLLRVIFELRKSLDSVRKQVVCTTYIHLKATSYVNYDSPLQQSHRCGERIDNMVNTD